MPDKIDILTQLPRFGASGEGLPDTPLLLPSGLKIYAVTNANPHRQVHGHGNYILSLQLAGRQTLQLEEYRIELKPGDAIFVPPFVSHAFSSDDGSHALKASFRLPPDELRLQGIAGTRFRMSRPLQRKFLAAARLFLRWYEGNSASADECVCAFAVLLRKIVGQVAGEIPRELCRNADHRRLTAVVEYLATHRDHRVSLKELSGALHLSGSTLRQLFKRQMHMSLGHYELTRRLTRGVELLRSTDLTAAEVAERVGFESAGSFLRALRRETGSASRAVRRTHEAQNE